ncbi:MAG: electron transfer flavoprotein subunit beta/FixA family protein [Thermoplasmatota archaeon]
MGVGMELVVLVKQVPNTADVRIDPKTGTLIREGVESVVNPDDLVAVEAAVQLRDECGARVTAVSMGPPQALDALREVLAMGVDAAVLLTDRAFAGADTLATSYTLGSAIKKLGGCDLVLCGHQAIDGDTAQIPPQVAELLDMPQLARAFRVGIEGRWLIAERETEEGTELLRCPLPALASLVRGHYRPRQAHLGRLLASFEPSAPIRVWGPAEIGADEARIGLRGSPTQVRRTYTPKVEKKCERLTGDPAAVAAALVARLRERRLVG